MSYYSGWYRGLHEGGSDLVKVETSPHAFCKRMSHLIPPSYQAHESEAVESY